MGNTTQIEGQLVGRFEENLYQNRNAYSTKLPTYSTLFSTTIFFLRIKGADDMQHVLITIRSTYKFYTFGVYNQYEYRINGKVGRPSTIVNVGAISFTSQSLLDLQPTKHGHNQIQSKRGEREIEREMSTRIASFELEYQFRHRKNLFAPGVGVFFFVLAPNYNRSQTMCWHVFRFECLQMG